jgi:hypothetical protein
MERLQETGTVKESRADIRAGMVFLLFHHPLFKFLFFEMPPLPVLCITMLYIVGKCCMLRSVI